MTETDLRVFEEIKAKRVIIDRSGKRTELDLRDRHVYPAFEDVMENVTLRVYSNGFVRVEGEMIDYDTQFRLFRKSRWIEVGRRNVSMLYTEPVVVIE